MENREEKACLCALNRIFGFEPRIGTALISHLGSATEVFKLGSKAIDGLLGPYSKYRGTICPKAVEDAAEELENLSEMGIDFIGWSEKEYPSLLRECEDAPTGIYIRSSTPAEELWKPKRRIAVVGTRDITPYGREWCERIVMALAGCPERPAIVSGLAIGTDICAHSTAMKAGLCTIGVMATGPESVYPYRHQNFALQMAATEGCALVTDYPPGTAPLPVHFLRRNRIIAGLCEATILIESRAKGGGMMTARLAQSYSRDVYALPGRIDDSRSEGCNILIQSRVAEAIAATGTLMASLGMKIPESRDRRDDTERLEQVYGNGPVPKDQVSRMARILLAIRRERGITIEGIAAATGMEYRTAAHLVGMLESDGLISTDLLQRCRINI